MDVTSKYSQVIIYYFSGTGNAKNASIWIKEEAESRGIKTTLINIDRFDKIEVPESAGKILIGFCSPTHGFNMPPLALKFIHKFPKRKNTDVFILNTRGGLKLSKLFLPGLSGLAQFYPALVLRLKGFRIIGMQPLDLPSNWIILHPGLRKHVINSIYQRCQNIITRFANRLLDGKKKYKAFLSFPFDLAVAPIALGYYFIGRFFLAKTLIATEDCNQCGICEKQCPVKAIKIIKDQPYWTYRCESCMRCINICPQRAIETAHGFSVLMFYVGFGILIPFLYAAWKSLNTGITKSSSYLSGQLIGILEWVIFILFVFLCYALLHYFLKFKFLNRIIAYSSFSKFKFWRRYHSPKYSAN